MGILCTTGFYKVTPKQSNINQFWPHSQMAEVVKPIQYLLCFVVDITQKFYYCFSCFVSVENKLDYPLHIAKLISYNVKKVNDKLEIIYSIVCEMMCKTISYINYETYLMFSKIKLVRSNQLQQIFKGEAPWSSGERHGLTV
jgi:hypothetical protein